MIFTNTDRQGFNKALSGVAGSAIRSVYTKPIMEPSYALDNISWLPFPYGPLPDSGPWIDKEDEAHKELPTPDGQTPGTEGTPWVGETGSNVIMFAVVIGAVLLLASKTKLLR